MTRTVRLVQYNVNRLSIREWGSRLGGYVGQSWRSEINRTITVKIGFEGIVVAETRPYELVFNTDEQWMPKHWALAMNEYAEQWPDSAPRLIKIKHYRNPKRTVYIP